MSIKTISFPILSLLALSSTQGQSFIGPDNGDWGTASNWSPAAVPSGVDIFINNTKIIDINSAVPDIQNLNITNNGTINTVNVKAGGDITMTGSTTVGAGLTGGEAYLNIMGGTLKSASLFGGFSADAAVGNINVSGGTLDLSGASLNIGTVGATNFTVTGSNIDQMIAQNGVIGANSNMTFDFTSSGLGIKELDIVGLLTVQSGATLTISTSGFSGGLGSYTLIDAGALSGVFTNIVFEGDYTGNVTQGPAGDVVVDFTAVPELSSTGFLLGLGSLGIVLLRRRS